MSYSPRTVIRKESSRDLEHYIVHLSDEFQDIRRDYEFGKLIIFDNIPDMKDKYKGFIDNHVMSIKTDVIQIKKAKAASLLEPMFKGHILHNFTHYTNDLQFAIKEIYNWVNYKILYECFPGYDVKDQNWTWRLTKTDAEEMHLDTYAGQSNDFHNVRIFINLDDKPRIWKTSYTIPTIYTKYNEIIQQYKKLHPNEINGHLNKVIKWNELPYHEFYFAPWAIWMCNSQWISHQAWYGNKMAAFTFRIDYRTMLHPNLNFEHNARSLIDNWHIKTGIP